MIDIKDPEDIYSWDLNKLWNAFNTIMNDDEMEDEYQEDYELIKYGIFINVPIRYLTEGYYTVYPHLRLVKIASIGKEGITKFYNEVDERAKRIRRILLSMERKKPTSGRVSKGRN